MKRFLVRINASVLTVCTCIAFLFSIPCFALKCDINNDGKLTIRDATYLLMYLKDNTTPVAADKIDVDGDHSVTMKDITALLVYLSDSGIDTEEPDYDGEINLSTLTNGQIVTLTKGGNYLVTGKAANAKIAINNKEEDFHLYLKNANLTYLGEGAAIQADKCDNCTLYMLKGTQNYLADSLENTEDAALQVKSGDLKLKGSGTLTITSKTEGIYNTKDLKIDGPTVNVTSRSHGVVVKKTVTLLNGTLTVNAKGDGIKAKGDVDDDGVSHKAGTGMVTVSGGTADITATKDGFDCEEGILVNGGSITVHSTGDGMKAVDKVQIDSGKIKIYASEDGIKTTKGELKIGGGNIYVESVGDGINAETNLSVTGSPVVEVKTGGGHTASAGETSCDGFKALGNINITGGKFTIDSAMYGIYAGGNLSGSAQFTVYAGNKYAKYYAGGTQNITTK